MLYGCGTLAGDYNGPPCDAVEFTRQPGQDLVGTVRRLKSQGFRSISVHTNVGSADQVAEEMERFRGLGLWDDITYFVAHVTVHTPYDGWPKWVPYRDKLRIENHNQQRMEPRQAGFCWPNEFWPLADAGFRFCLDLGHILMCSLWETRTNQVWSEEAQNKAEFFFSEFLKLPIAASHVHTLGAHPGYPMTDHITHGVFDVGPWVRRLVGAHPDVTLINESFIDRLTDTQKLEMMRLWAGV